MVNFTKLDRFLAKEITLLTLVITAGISSIMIMAKLPRYAEFLFSAPDTGITFLMLILYVLPAIIKLVIPVSLLLATATVFTRMSADREIEGWMAGGTSTLRFLITPSLLGIILMTVSLLSSLFFEPYSNQQFEKFKWMQTRNAVEALLKNTLREKSFLFDFPTPDNVKIALYFQKINDKGNQFSNVFFALQRPSEVFSSVVVSHSGRLQRTLTDGFPDYVLILQNGDMYSGSGGNWYTTTFNETEISLVNAFKNKFKVNSTPTQGTDQLYPAAYFKLLKDEKQKNPDWTRDKRILYMYLFFLKQLSLPISTIFLPVIGVFLGIQDARQKQMKMYFGVGMVIFALYASLFLAQELILKFIIHPNSILFVTPIVLIFVILVLALWRFRYPPSSGFLDFLKDDFRKLFKISPQRK